MGLADVIKQQPALRNIFQLKLIGSGPGGVEARRIAQKYNISDNVQLLPEMPHSEVLKQMNDADVLVVIKFDNSAYDMQIPGKLFEYLGRGKPILGVMRDCEAADILRKSGLGVIAQDNDVGNISRLIRTMLDHRDILHSLYAPKWAYISTFSQAAMSCTLNNCLEEVTTRHRGSKGLTLAI